jgi:hypothetical protein
MKNNYEKISQLKDAQFKRMTGVPRKVFEQMVGIMREAIAKRATKRGNQSVFSVEEQVLIMLEYYREYRTMYHIGISWGVHESTIYRIIDRVERALSGHELLKLPSRKEVMEMRDETVVVDVTEVRIERPKKK